MNPFVITGAVNGAIGANRAVKLNPSVTNGIMLPAAATDEVVGITRDATTAAGQACAVQVDGLAEVVATSAVTRGAYAKVDTAGGIVATVTAADKAIGIVTRAAGAGEIAQILIKRFTV